MAFEPPLRRFVLFCHVATSVGFLGAIASFLALAVVGATVRDQSVAGAAYLAMAVITWWVVVPLAAASLLIGVVQSLGTPWGLIRYYWVLVKLVLTIVACAVLALQTNTIQSLSEAATSGNLGGMSAGRSGMVVHAAGGLAVILIATLLSIYKPRGMTRFGAKEG